MNKVGRVPSVSKLNLESFYRLDCDPHQRIKGLEAAESIALLSCFMIERGFPFKGRYKSLSTVVL